MKKSAELLQEINAYIEQLPYERQPMSLYEPIRYVLSIGGKRIRPVLMLLAYNLYKEDTERILPSACALETYHNYTLLHDDLMDHAPMRRGHQTVHERWDANTAILSGDTMLVLAYERMAQCVPEYFQEVLRLFTETALEIGEGQQYDIEFETRDAERVTAPAKENYCTRCLLSIGSQISILRQRCASTPYELNWLKLRSDKSSRRE